MEFLSFSAGQALELPQYGTLRATSHVFDRDSIEAINASLATGRPLLVRGEPGTGKSQLARAAATALGRAFVSFTIDARTEARDLLLTVDTVARLAEAQIVGHLGASTGVDIREQLDERRFTTPGPLWWVFAWSAAAAHLECNNPRALPPWTTPDWRPEHGVVLLVDEIDKADSAVPNGLLEALGMVQFRTPWGEVVTPSEGAPPPLVVLTTNEERALPNAFVRRCLVLQLGWPADPEELKVALIDRGRAHFPDLTEEVLLAAADMLAKDRAAAINSRSPCPPGGAEYLDLLRAVAVRFPRDPAEQLEALERIRGFALNKHPAEAGQ